MERAHEVLEDQLGHHPYMGICVQTLAQYHDDMLNINFSAEYNQVGISVQVRTTNSTKVLTNSDKLTATQVLTTLVIISFEF